MNKKLFLTTSLLLTMLVGCGDNISSPSTSENIVQYTVTFMVDGKVYSTQQVNQNEKINKVTNPEKDGYKFTGWFKSELCLENELFNFETETIDNNLTLYAGFEEDISKLTCTITFDLDGGTWSNENQITIQKGLAITEPTKPTKDGYKFIGWSKTKSKDNLYDFSSPVNEDFTLFAIYEEISVTPKYKITGSSQESLSHQVNHAVDGNEETYWKAKDNSKQTLTIDLESVKQVNFVSQEFVDLNTWNFKIEGSFDNVNYATLLSNSDNTSGTKFESNVIGFYRYIKLTIEESEVVATSKEFIVNYETLDNGTNIAYGMKGISDCHAANYEPERMFDGNEGNYHCAAGNHEGHYMGMDANKLFYVKTIELIFPDATDHKFYVDYRLENNEWKKLEVADLTNNTEAKNTFKFDVNDKLSAILVHYNGNTTGNWPALCEMKVNGFKELLSENTTEGNKTTIDLGHLSFVGEIELLNQVTKIEISQDGTNYEEIDLSNKNEDKIIINKDAKFIRYSTESQESTNSLKIWGIQYIRNVALLTNPTATTHSSDAGFWENMMTFNKDCAQAASRFYCTSAYANKEEINLDLGNISYIEQINYKYQDATTENVQCLKVEVSLDGKNYTSLYDTLENPTAGQLYEIKVPNESRNFRYIKITTQITNGWTNCNTLELMGIGSAKI